jgi:hypothetical protein
MTIFHRHRFLAAVAVAAGFLGSAGAAEAQNLNQKYGPGWRCGAISYGRSAELNALYNACLPCERAGQDFFQTGPGTGRCVPRAGGGSAPSASSGGDRTGRALDAIREFDRRMQKQRESSNSGGSGSGRGADPDEESLASRPASRQERPFSPDNPFVNRSGTGSLSPDNPFANRGGTGLSDDNPFKPQAAAGDCVRYFTEMHDEMKRLADVCAARTGLIQDFRSLITYQGKTSTYGDLLFTRDSAQQLFIVLRPGDPRWQLAHDEATPNCSLPLRVATQYEAFTECSRVYACGARAAACGLAVAKAGAKGACPKISEACLAQNPIPTGVEAVAPVPVAKEEAEHARSLGPGPSARGAPDYSKSSISGPSPRGGGAPPGPVRSAR